MYIPLPPTPLPGGSATAARNSSPTQPTAPEHFRRMYQAICLFLGSWGYLGSFWPLPRVVVSLPEGGPKMASRWSKLAPRWPKMASTRPKIAPRWPHQAPRWYQKSLKKHEKNNIFATGLQLGPERAQDGPRWPNMAPRWPQDGLNKPQDGPKMASR